MRPFPLLFALLLAAEPAAEAPPAPAAPTVSIPENATGSEVLQIAIDELTAGRYDNAMAIAIPSIAKYPDLGPSFRAVADVAADQLERQRQAPVMSTTPGDPAAPIASYPPITSRRPAPGRSIRKVQWGFDLGLPTGLRVEWRLGGRVVDGVGLRIGGNLIAYDGVHDIGEVTLYSDFRVADRWQIEVVAGLLTYYGWPYPQIGGAVQYDTKGSMQANLGMRVGPYGSVMPDVGVGFIW